MKLTAIKTVVIGTSVKDEGGKVKGVQTTYLPGQDFDVADKDVAQQLIDSKKAGRAGTVDIAPPADEPAESTGKKKS